MLTISDEQILAARGPKNPVDMFRPYHVLTEKECGASGKVEDVATVFLTNRECPFRCLMCDLWKNTTDAKVPVGAIPAQIRTALQTLPPAEHIKLYNSGNFFDTQAIPSEDFPQIAELVRGFQSVIVENHPKLCTTSCVQFRDLCDTQLEIAMGLESSHEPTLATLNKQMTTDDFAAACEFLRNNDIRIRTFILLRPPGITEEQGIEQAIDSVRFAFNCGVNCCAVIPTRPGNGIMNRLQQTGQFTSPRLNSLETVLNQTLSLQQGRVFADLWDAEQFSDCPACVTQRIDRLNNMNLTQSIQPPVQCDTCHQ
jgi:radical SAM enzyme (TIGR01210 family)